MDRLGIQGDMRWKQQNCLVKGEKIEYGATKNHRFGLSRDCCLKPHQSATGCSTIDRITSGGISVLKHKRAVSTSRTKRSHLTASSSDVRRATATTQELTLFHKMLMHTHEHVPLPVGPLEQVPLLHQNDSIKNLHHCMR